MRPRTPAPHSVLDLRLSPETAAWILTVWMSASLPPTPCGWISPWIKAGSKPPSRFTVPSCLVLDPLVRVHMIDENVSAQMAALLGYFRTLQRKTGVAVALVHHARKQVSPGAGAGYSLRGSSDLYAWLDSFLYLRKNRDQLTLSAEHRAAPSFGPLALELAGSSSPDAGTYLKVMSAAPRDCSTVADLLPSRILQLLSDSPEPLTVENLRSKLQVRNQRLVEALRQLSSQGKVERLPQGYTIKRSPSRPTDPSLPTL